MFKSISADGRRRVSLVENSLQHVDDEAVAALLVIIMQGHVVHVVAKEILTDSSFLG